MRILEVTLACVDLERQTEFWGDTLGVTVRRDRRDQLEVHLRSSVIRFEAGPLGAGYHFAINIPPDAIERAADWVAERHELLAFHGDPDEAEGATIVRTDRGAATLYFRDGDGNVVELISSPHLGGEPAGPFGPESLLEVAEIGIASADTAATRTAVQRLYDADILWGGGEGSLLTAIGDDHGVVIVAPIGRGWIPIGLPARPLPTAIVARGQQAGEVVLADGLHRLAAVADPTG